MSAAIQVDNIEAGADSVTVSGHIVLSGNYPTGGDTLDFTNTTPSSVFHGVSAAIPSTKAPTSLQVTSQGGLLGYGYSPSIGSAMNNSKLKVGNATTYGTEFSAGAYAAALTGDSIGFVAIFPKLQ